MKVQCGLGCSVACLIALSAGCSGTANQEQAKGDQGGALGETGLALVAAVHDAGTTDVDALQYSIGRVACFDGEKFEALDRTISVRLEDMMLPGGIPAFEGSPLDDGSRHPFSDHFEVVPAGCYNIDATPLTAGGAVSADCSIARARGLEVLDGETTEVFLISQCKGAAVGAVDAVVALNQPPQLEQLTYSPSKFIHAGDTAKVCVTASDPNGDPVQFAWSQIDDAACYGPTVVFDQVDGDRTTECVGIVPAAAGKYLFDVKIYDMIHAENGQLVRVESWLRAHGYPNDSHDSLRFPLYAGTASSASAGASGSVSGGVSVGD